MSLNQLLLGTPTSKPWCDIAVHDLNANLVNAVTLNVSGSTVFSGDLDVKGNTLLEQKLDVLGQSTVAGLEASGNAQFDQKVDVKGNALLEAKLDVLGQSTLAGLEASGNAQFDQKVDVKGDALLEAKLDVLGQSTVAGLEASGDAKFDQKVHALGDVTFDQKLDVVGNTTLFGLEVKSPATFDSTLDVLGATTVFALEAKADVKFDQKLEVVSDVKCDAKLEVVSTLTTTFVAPSDNGISDLGTIANKYGDLYLGGSVGDANNPCAGIYLANDLTTPVSQFNYYQQASMASSFSGAAWAAPPVTSPDDIRITRVGNVVHLFLPSILAAGAGGTTATCDNILPAAYFPPSTFNSSNTDFEVPMIINAVQVASGRLTVTSAGVISFEFPAVTAGAVNGWANLAVSYHAA